MKTIDTKSAEKKIEMIRDLLETAPLDVVSAETLYEVIMDVIENN